MRVKLDFSGPSHIFAGFSDPVKVEAAAVNAAQPVLARHAMAMVKQIRRTIVTRGGSAGVKWPIHVMPIRLKGHGAILQDSRTLLWGISAWQTGSGRNVVWRVGLRPGKMHPTARLSLAQLANIHEHGARRRGGRRSGRGGPGRQRGRGRSGSWHVPPRPFLKPTIDAHLMQTFATYIPLFFKVLVSQMSKNKNIKWVTNIVG